VSPCITIIGHDISMDRVFQKKSSPPPINLWNIFTSVRYFCVKFYRFVGNSYPYVSVNFCTFILIFHQMALIFPWVPIVFTVSVFGVLNADTSWARTWWESHHFQLYPDKWWKLSTVKKVCSRVDHTGSAVLRKPGSGTGRPATASACAVRRCKTIFPLIGPTEI